MACGSVGAWAYDRLARIGVLVWGDWRGCVGGQGFEADCYHVGVWCVWWLCDDMTSVAARPIERLSFEVVFCIGSALQTGARSLTQITGGRAIGGLGVGALRHSSGHSNVTT